MHNTQALHPGPLHGPAGRVSGPSVVHTHLGGGGVEFQGTARERETVQKWARCGSFRGPSGVSGSVFKCTDPVASAVTVTEIKIQIHAGMNSMFVFLCNASFGFLPHRGLYDFIVSVAMVAIE